MKKITTLLVSILTLALVMMVPIQGAEFDLVADGVGVLTDEEYFELNELAEDIRDKYQCEVSIVVIEDTGNDEITQFTNDFYKEYDYGYGEKKSGLMLLVSTADRDYALVAYGDGNIAFTDYGKDQLAQKYLLPMLGEDKYYSAFLTYLGKTDEFLQRAAGGNPVDSNEASDKSPWIKWAIIIGLPLLIAGIVCFIFLGQMKTAVPQREADYYIADGGFDLTMQTDQFMYTTEKRTRIQEKTSGGGTSVGSGGSSSKKGKF